MRRRRTRKEFLGTLALVSGAALLFPSSAIVVRRTPRGRAIPGATNALERQTLGMYSAWFAWLNRAGVPGYLGETNTPNVEKPWPQSQVDLWLTLLDKVYATIDEAGPTIAGVTAHVASITESGGGGFKVYGPDRSDVPLSQRNFSEVFQQASVIEAHPPTPDSMRGMNTSAGAMTPDTFGPSNPGTYATDYVYPDGSDYEYLLSRGHNLTRVPFRWERVQVRDARQPSSNPALKAAEIARLAASFDAAASVGMNVIPSVQNYGAYVFSTSIFGTENLGKIGSSKLPISAYAAFMKQLAAAFAGHPAVAGLDIMNEPRQLSGSPPARTWEQASQAAVEAIREISTTLKLWIAGYHTPPSGSYPGLYSFIANHPEPWIVAENFGYTSHCYYGPGSGYPNSYDEAVALWEVKGY